MRDKFLNLRRSLAVLAAAALMAVGFASPARAQDINGCNDSSSASGWGMICFFDGTNYGKGYWSQFDIWTVLQEPGDCWQFSANEINRWSSFVYNPTVTGMNALNGYVVRFWPNNDCFGTPVPTYNARYEEWDADLRTTSWGNVSNVMNSWSIELA